MVGNENVTFEQAVRYVCALRFGYLSVLKKVIGDSRVNELVEAGFLACGRNSQNSEMKDTWKVTDAGVEYSKTMYNSVLFSF